MFSKTVRLTLFFAVFFAAVAGIYSKRGTTTVVLDVFYTKMVTAFERRDYDDAIEKIHQLLARAGPDTDGSYETLYFHLGMANLLAGNLPEAETSFKDCISRYPEGKYFYRCHLGLGRMCMLGEGEEWKEDAEWKENAMMLMRRMQSREIGVSAERKEQAIQALKIAAKDRNCAMEAGHWLTSVYTDLNRRDEALAVCRDMIGTEVRTPQQTTAAVEHIAFLSNTNDLSGLSAWLEYISDQPGVKNLMAWFVNQVVVEGDKRAGEEQYESALALYRAVPSRNHILKTQKAALKTLRKQRNDLEKKVEEEWSLPFNRRSSAVSDLSYRKSAVTLTETAMKAIEEKPDLDAALLMRRGRCLFYLQRDEEALTCFRTLIKKFPASSDAESAAYAEIMILNKRKDIEGIKEKSGQFMRKYPESKRLEQVATLAGEVLVQSGKWKEVGDFYRKMETKFPKSESLDRFVFFQALAFFQDANFKESTPLFEKFLKNFPTSPLVENALYYLAMSHFLSNNYEKTLDSCRDYLAKFPGGKFVGDLQHRLAFIDFNDKEVDQTDKIIRELGDFLKEHSDDLVNGHMLCLMGDTYLKKKEKAQTDEERKKYEDLALQCFDKVIWMKDRPDDVIQYALDTSTTILQKRKDWKAIAELHGKFIKANPKSPLALLSVIWVAKAFARDGRAADAAELILATLKSLIADPSCEQVEPLIDELVKSIVPRKKVTAIDYEAIDKQLVDLCNKILGDQKNATTEARVLYARARLAQMLRREDLFDFYLKGIATLNIKDPSALSPVLLAVSGDILLKGGDLDGAEKMFKHLEAHYPTSEYVDTALVGLGYIALSRNKPEQALGIFDKVIRKQGNRGLKEATLGKIKVLIETNRLEPAKKLALDVVGDKSFRGETAAKACLLLGLIYRKQAAAAEDAKARELLWKAHEVYKQVYVAYQRYPALCLDAYLQAYEVLLELKEDDKAKETLEAAREHPKFKDMAREKEARERLK